jgi:hypothetical protein
MNFDLCDLGATGCFSSFQSHFASVLAIMLAVREHMTDAQFHANIRVKKKEK